LVKERIPVRFGFDPKTDIQVLLYWFSLTLSFDVLEFVG